MQRRDASAYGNDPVNWAAAAPTPGRPGVQPPLIITSVALDGSQITFSVESRRGLAYYLEYKNDLKDPEWTSSPPAVPGTGSVLVFRDDVLAGTNRFYRIRTGI